MPNWCFNQATFCFSDCALYEQVVDTLSNLGDASKIGFFESLVPLPASKGQGENDRGIESVSNTPTFMIFWFK
jgi:hypothetical protein